MTVFLMIFRRFPTTFQRFPKIFQNCSEGQTNVSEHFPRISEDFRRFPKTFEEDPKMFRWYTYEFKYNLRDKQKQKAEIVMSLNDTTLTKVTYGKYATRVPDEVAYGIYEWFSSQYNTPVYIIITDIYKVVTNAASANFLKFENTWHILTYDYQLM